jgi:hypothetical protein
MALSAAPHDNRVKVGTHPSFTTLRLMQRAIMTVILALMVYEAIHCRIVGLAIAVGMLVALAAIYVSRQRGGKDRQESVGKPDHEQ